MRYCALLFLLLCFRAQLPGQAGSLDEAEAYQALEQGDSCVQAELYTAARDYYLKALPYFVSREDFEKQAYLYLWLSETSYYEGDIQRAMEEAQYSRLLAESCLEPDTLPFYCTTLQNLGVFHSGLSDFNRQMEYYRKALAAALHHHGYRSRQTADAYLSVGAAYGRRGQWRECIAHTDTSFQIAEQIAYRGGMGSALLNLSHSYAQLEDFERAIQYQKEALSVTASQEEKARGYNNLGSQFIDMGAYPEALQTLHQALQLRRRLYTGYNSNVSSTLLNISRAHSESGRLDSAGYYLEQAIEGLWKAGGRPDAALLQIAYNYQCKLLLQDRQLEAAERAVRKGLSLGGNWRDINGSSYMLLGESLLAQRKYDEALAATQTGLQWQAAGFQPKSLMENPPWEKLESIAQARGLLKLKGDILREAGLAHQSHRLLIFSLQAFQQADSLLMWSRNTFQSRASRDQLAANSNELYAGALQTLYHLYQQTKDTAYFDQALAFSEKNKALSVLENLNSLYANSFFDIPDEVVEGERRLLEEIEFYSKLAKAGGQGAEEWERQLFRLRRQQDSLLEEIRQRYPRYYEMKHGFQLAAVRPLQQELLAEGETLLEYFLDGDSAFVLLLSRQKRRFYRLPVPGLAEKLLQLRRATAYQTPDFFALNHEMYQSLVAPLADELQGERLAIVPDDVMAYLPFELLLTAPAGPGEPRHDTLPYLIRKFSIRYFFSANTALQAQRNELEAGRGNGQLLGLAPEFSDRSIASREGSAYGSLPGAQAELDSLQASFRGLFLRGKAASEANFKLYSGRYSIYHIATHATIDRELPSGSHLVLEAGQGQDGRLHAYELYNHRMAAELAVLSACNTGIGEIRRGEGSASLAHAFAYAGCPNLVMSLWPIKDRVTPTLIKKYYSLMAEGEDKCDALWKAKLHCLEYDPLFAHPFYWSGFIYVGEREPLYLRPRPYFSVWAFLLAVSGLIIFAILLKGRGRL